MQDHTTNGTPSKPTEPFISMAAVVESIDRLWELRKRLWLINDICEVETGPDGTAIQDAIKGIVSPFSMELLDSVAADLENAKAYLTSVCREELQEGGAS